MCKIFLRIGAIQADEDFHKSRTKSIATMKLAEFTCVSALKIGN